MPASSEEDVDDVDLGSSGDDGNGLDEDSALFGSAGQTPACLPEAQPFLSHSKRCNLACPCCQHLLTDCQASMSCALCSVMLAFPSSWLFSMLQQ